MVFYRLEICPTVEGREYYKNADFPNNDNAGYDTVVVKDMPCSASNVTLLPLGFSARMMRVYDECAVMAGAPPHEEEVHFWLAPRSSIWKSRVMLANSMGVIDRTYRGELKAAVLAFQCGAKDAHIEKGTRLTQILAPDMGWIKEVRIVEALPETQRGAGGFGSTGLTAAAALLVSAEEKMTPAADSETSQKCPDLNVGC